MDAVNYTPLTHSISSKTNMKIQVGKAQYGETRVSLIPFSGQGHYAKDFQAHFVTLCFCPCEFLALGWH
jgi:hypothetical protein